uniref:Uncharacterized protein n=1 Tax=Zea mays TaxID=4577 RepID=A0A804QUR5_MAIZE
EAPSSGTRGGLVEIERTGFVCDVCFLLVAFCYLLAVLLIGSVTVWVAASFLSLYAAYVLLVWTSHCYAEDGTTKPVVDEVAAAGPDPDLAAPLLAEDLDEPPALPISSKNAEAAAPPRRGRSSLARRALHALQWLLYLPCHLTIPDIAAHRWSKRYAVASALLAPLLLAAISSPSSPAAALSGAVAGTVLAAAAARSSAGRYPERAKFCTSQQ